MMKFSVNVHFTFFALLFFGETEKKQNELGQKLFAHNFGHFASQIETFSGRALVREQTFFFVLPGRQRERVTENTHFVLTVGR